MTTPASPETAPEKAPAKAPATKALTPFEEVKRNLMSEESKKQFEMALPPQMKPEKFLRVAITAVNKTPELLECTRQSLYQSFILAAQDGLLPDGREAAIVKYQTKAGPTATYMPMVGGILKKIRNSGELQSIAAKVVREHDEFKYWIDENGEHIQHMPARGDDTGKVTDVYALAKTRDGGVYVEVMSRAEVEKVRSASKASGAGPWTQWWDEMAKKTAIRRLAKRLPMSTDLEDVIRRDDHLYDPNAKVEASLAESAKEGPSRLQKMLQEKPIKEIEGEANVVTDQPAAGETSDAK